MLRYYISEEQIIGEFKMFRIEDAFAQKAQNLSKYAGKKSKSKNRIYESWKSLGPVDKMADKVGHSFTRLFLVHLRREFGLEIKHINS